MTEEQLDLMFEHFLIDNPELSKKTTTAVDPDYKEDEEPIGDREYTPVPEHEHFEDPEFDEVWNATDEELDSDIVGENPSFDDSKPNTDPDQNTANSDMDDDWEEV